MIKISQQEYAQRRKNFLALLKENSIAIIPATPVHHKTADSDYSYHPNTNLYYLTGYQEPHCVAVFIPDRSEGSFILFNLAKNRTEEIWHGIRIGQIGAVSDFGVDQAFVIDEFSERIVELMQGKKHLYFSFGRNAAYDDIILNTITQLKARVRAGVAWPTEIIDADTMINQMRVIKSPAEIEMLRYVCNASVEAHKAAMKRAKPGLNEYHIHAELLYNFINKGCQGAAYESIVAAGPNGIVLHYNSNNMPLHDGDLLLVDAGAEYNFYDADITTTYPINGRFSQEQKIIYDLVLKSQKAALDIIRPGLPWPALQDAITRVITEGLIELGILAGDVEQLLADRAFFKFYMHKSGHWLGLDTHDVGAYKVNDVWRTLEAGMVFTVEPGLYLSKDTPGLDPKWHEIAVRIEDDVLVTETGFEKLTDGLPRTTDDIEKFMAS